MVRRGWYLTLALAAALALVSLAANVTTVSQLSGESDLLWTARWTISKVANAGSAWAGLLILSGWLVRRPAHAAAAGIASAVTALIVHYGVGQLFGIFDSTAWSENLFWFAAAVVAGGPLGLVGAVARRHDLWGLPARLVVPVGAVLEPFYLGMFTLPAMLPWPDRASGVLSGVILVAAGTAGGATVLARRRARQSAHRATRRGRGHAGR